MTANPSGNWGVPAFEVDGNMGYDFGDVDGWCAAAVAEINRLRAIIIELGGPESLHS